LARSVFGSSTSGAARSGGAVRRTARPGDGSRSWRMTFSPGPASFIRGRKSASPSNTRGGSRVPEWGPLGSVRGALSNERPYRDLRNVVANYALEKSRRFAGNQPNSGHGESFSGLRPRATLASFAAGPALAVLAHREITPTETRLRG